MALDLGTLAFKLKADDSAVDSTLRGLPAKGRRAGQDLADGFTRDANGRLHDARGRFVRAGQDIGRNIGRGAESGMRPSLGTLTRLFAGLGIARMTGELLGFGTRTAMVMEKANISFTTLLGSGKRAQAFMAQLKQFASTTPFEFTELQSSASQLLAAGISAKKVVPIMTTLGNVTSGMGTGSEGIQRAVVALQQMNAAGKITGEDLNQLRDAGIPVYDLLAAATGRSKAEIVKLAQAGKLGGKDLAAMMKALETGKGLERFNGLMDKQSQSLEGVISTLKDTVGQGLAEAMAPIIPMMKEGIAGLSDSLPAILNGLRGFGQWISDNRGLLAALAKGIGIVVGLFTLWTVAQWALNAAMAANPVSLIVIAIAALVAGLVWAYDNVDWFRTMVDASFKVIGAAATWLWVNAIQPAFQAIGDFSRWLWNNALQPFIKATMIGFAMLAGGVANLLDALSTVPGFEWAKDAANGLRSLADAALKASTQVGKIEDPAVDTGDSQKEVDDLDKKIKSLKGKIVKAKAEGDDKELAKLKKKLADMEKEKHEIKVQASLVKVGSGISYNSRVSVDGTGQGRITLRAGGGRTMPGELTLLGELGPELVKLPTGSHVYTANQTRQMLSSSGRSEVGVPGGQAPINVNTTVNGANFDQAEQVASALVKKVTSARRLAGAGFER